MQQFGGKLGKIDLQKLLFLFCDSQNEPSYCFIPYNYGCFSFQANQDISTMVKYSQIEESDNHWQVIDKKDYLKELKMKDRIDIVRIYNKFKDLRGDSLIKFVYKNYPYFAIRSKIARKLLDEEDYHRVIESVPIMNDVTLFTIGYESKSVESYTNQLIRENIKVLCDVRKNPLSMKYGFSKNQLKNIVENVGIEYIQIPGLGIESDKRKDLKTETDFFELFNDYTLNTLPQKKDEISKLCDILIENKRIALTCFEADYNCCHRSRVSDAISEYFSGKYLVKHI